MTTTSESSSPAPLTMIEALRFAVVRVPDNAALLSPERPSMPYRDLLQQVDQLVGELNGVGLTTHSRVLLLIPDAVDLVAALIAVSAGFVAVVLNPDYLEQEIEYTMRLSHADALIVTKGYETPARDLATKQGIRVIELVRCPDRTAGKINIEGGEYVPPTFSKPEDVAVLLSTSGTTGMPKLIAFTHQLAFKGAYNPPFWDLFASSTENPQTSVNMLPVFHMFGFSGITFPIAYGSGILALRGFNVEDFYRYLDEYHLGGFNALPVMIKAIVEAAPAHQEIIDRAALKIINVSSAPLSAELALEVERIFRCQLISAYGMTEVGGIAYSYSGFKAFYKPGSVGQPMVETGIMGEDGSLLSAGQIGEIVVHDTALFRGYVGSPEAGSHLICEGWFHTGDLGYLDEQNFLFITGRLKEVINRGGEKISPTEVEVVLLRHPAVKEAAVFSVPHLVLGEDVAAAVVLRDVETKPQDIRKFVSQQLSAVKVPSTIHFLSELPVTPTGKIRRTALPGLLGLVDDEGKRIEGRSRLAQVSVAPRSETEQRLLTIWQNVLGVDELGIHDDFFDLGGTSLKAAELVVEIARDFHMTLPIATLFDAVTVAEMGEVLASLDENAVWPTLIPIQPSGQKPPLFCFPGLSGVVLSFQPLALALGVDQPVYGLQPPGIDGKTPPLKTLADLTTLFVEEIRTQQPNGPYLLAGYSFGSLVALEAAHMLRIQGEEVALLASIDGPFGLTYQVALRQRITPAEKLLRRANWHLEQMAELNLLNKTQYILNHLEEQRQPDVELELERQVILPGTSSVAKANRRMMRSYQPPQYEEKVVVFATESTRAESVAAGSGKKWSEFLRGGIEICDVPGDHATVLHEIHAGILAAKLAGYIDRALAEVGTAQGTAP